MTNRLHDSILIQRSVEDDAFLVSLPEWSPPYTNPVTHGSTYEEALANTQEALTMFIEIAEQSGSPLPAPLARGAVSEAA